MAKQLEKITKVLCTSDLEHEGDIEGFIDAVLHYGMTILEHDDQTYWDYPEREWDDEDGYGDDSYDEQELFGAYYLRVECLPEQYEAYTNGEPSKWAKRW
jgi:hypothetical protein